MKITIYKTTIVIMMIVLSCFTSLIAQTDNSNTMQASYQPAEFPGGTQALFQFIADNLIYPEKAWEEDIEGKVIAAFTITKDGDIENIEIEQSLSEECDKEVERLIGIMPKWNPTERNGKKIASPYKIPITFKKQQGVIAQEANDSIPPQYPGGEKALNEFIRNNLRYPERALKNKIQGTVLTTFTITEEGKIMDIKILRSIDKELDKEAVRVIKRMKNWIPAKKNGEPIQSTYRLPMGFRIYGL